MGSRYNEGSILADPELWIFTIEAVDAYTSL
jgi:hypothetical protein